MSASKRAIAGIAITFLMTACVSRDEIAEIKQNQKEILSKLEKLASNAGPARRPARPRGPDPKKVYSFSVGESAADGPSDAWVTVVEVSDFQCPFCKRVLPTLKQVKETYGKDVRVVFKHNPLSFHDRAMPAANAAECANEQGKFWGMHDELFGNQRSLSDTDFEGYAKKVGVNMGKWKACYKANKYKARIDADQKMAVSLGARGTPAFFVNGRFLSGAQPFTAFKALIDEELKKAKESGLARSSYYKTRIEAKGAKAM